VSTGAALAVTLILLAAVNVWVHVGSPRSQLVTGPLAALALLLVARGAGLTWAQLGLARHDLLTGVVYGAVAAGAIALVYVVAVAVPFTRGAFLDTRYRIGTRAALFVAVVTIPLTTVLFEEVAFRSVLWGLLREDHDVVVATAVSAALFGLWHVLPALKLARTNTAVTGGGDGRGSRTLLTVLGTVAFTTAAGVLFAELRRRSGSVAAPMVLHWATNGLGALAAARAWSLTSRRAG
jgi:membrane protease YdiL (CAAX protease family)